MAKKGLKIIEKRNGVGSIFKDANGETFTKTELIKSPQLRSIYDVTVVKTKDSTYIRSLPDKRKKNNLE